MSLFKLSNQIFEQGLQVKELCVYAYLCSIHATEQTLEHQGIVHVKQSTIGENCGISSVQTVKKVMDKLIDKGLVTQLRRSVKHNGYKGTYYYSIKQLPMTDGYFFVERKALKQLTPRQMYVYLFICKSWDAKRNDCWNSFQDIAEQIRMKREIVIQTINELRQMRCIVRLHRKSNDNRHVYVDNHYQVIQYVTGKIKGKIKERLYRKYNRSSVSILECPQTSYNQYTTEKRNCQDLLLPFFIARGSPKFESP